LTQGSQGFGECIRPSVPRTGLHFGEKAYPVDTSPAIAKLIQQFDADQVPIDISFRKLVSWLKVGERGTHYLHPYPAKLLPHIAHFFLAAQTVARSNDNVLDPFGGSGSVALETILSGREALYAEVNPLARLIARVKTQQISRSEIEGIMDTVRKKFALSRNRTPPDVINIDHWFSPCVIRSLCRLKSAISVAESQPTSDFLLATFSAVVRKVSLADPRFSVPVKRNKNQPPSRIYNGKEVWNVFENQISKNLERIDAMNSLKLHDAKAMCVGNDARNLKQLVGSNLLLPDGSVGLVMTSPPYAGAQKYVRSTSLSLGWLGLAKSNELRGLEGLTIGREHYPKASTKELKETGVLDADAVLKRVFSKNKLRAAIAASYLIEMRAALTEAVRVLRPKGNFVLIIGDNNVCGETFKSSDYLRQILETLGMELRLHLVDRIPSRGLITRRADTAGVIATESVLLFEKGASFE